MQSKKDNNLYAKAFLFSIVLFIGLFVIQLFAVLFMEYLSPGEIKSLDQNLSLIHLVFLSWFNFVFCIILYYVFEFVIEKRKLNNITFSFLNRSIIQTSVGIALVLVIITIYLGIYLGTGSVKIQFQNPEKVYLIILFALFFAISEELVFRGYLLGIFIRNNQKFIGILVSSILFTLVHIFNPQINALAIFTIFLVGLFLGLVTARLKTIYFAIGFHAAFNFLGTFLGFNQLFQDNKHALLKIETISTGKFYLGEINGITGSIILSILLIVFIFLFLLREKLFTVGAGR